MSHYKIKSITVKDDTVIIYAQASNVSPREWFRSPIMGHENDSLYKQFQIVGRELYDGGFQFPKWVKCHAKTVYDNCIQRFGTWRQRRDVPFTKEYNEKRERFAREFARRMCA